jgi:hypothetical protein
MSKSPIGSHVQPVHRAFALNEPNNKLMAKAAINNLALIINFLLNNVIKIIA